MTNRNQDASNEFLSKADPADRSVLEKFATQGLGAFSKEFHEAAEQVNPRAFANFLLEQANRSTTSSKTREELRQLAKMIVDTADASAKANMASPAARRFKNAGQPVQKNVAPATSGLSELLGTTKSDVALGDKARHARYCMDNNGLDKQGRNCSICHGAGFHAHAAMVAKRQQAEPEE